METPESSQWPTAWILGYGSFGPKTPASRRYHVRTATALIVLTIVWPVTFFLWLFDKSPTLLWQVIAGLAPAVIYGYIGWEMRRYWLTLDELARRLQMEAAAYTYLLAFAAAPGLGGISLILYGHDWVWMVCNPLWLILLEFARAGILYYLARRY
jgi:hypothetical protein